MNKIIEVNNVALGVKELNHQRVITFKDMDRVHERPDGTAKRNFTSNRDRLIKNTDYYLVKPADISMDEKRPIGFTIPNKGITLLTESGYLMLVKSFTDDLAWEVQRKLVNVYFREKDGSDDSATSLLEPIITTLVKLQQDISDLKDSQSKQIQPPKKKYSRWSTKMHPKYLLLMDYFDISRTELYHNLYMELENTYPDIDLAQIREDYCYMHGLEDCYPLVAIEHTKHIRELFELLVDSLLEKYKLCTPDEISTCRRTTIFDD